MKILASEKLSEHKFKDNNGYLICTDCILSRTGKQTYRRDEVFKDGSNEEVEVDRLADEVFSKESLASFENCPVCINHPDCNVGPENHNELSVGFVRNVRQGDFEGQPVMMGDLVITDAKAIDLIESGDMVELSCGYDCDIDDEDNPQQKNIRGNHVALCEQGRAGIARIVDSIELDEKLFGKDLHKDKITVLKSKSRWTIIKLWDYNDVKKYDGAFLVVENFNKSNHTFTYYWSENYYDNAEKAFKDFVKRSKDSIEDRREGKFNIRKVDEHYVIECDGKFVMSEDTEDDAIRAARNGEAEEAYNSLLKIKKEDKYIIKATNVRGMYINQKGAGQYTHYSNAKRFTKKEAEAKIAAMNRNNGSYNWVIEKVNDSIEDNIKEFGALKKRIQNAKSRKELKEIMVEVDAHKDDNQLSAKEYRDLIRLSENLKDSITTQRINKIINGIYGGK